MAKTIRAPANKRGAPRKRDGDKIGNNHLRQDQTERINELVSERSVPFVVILREAVDFYLQAVQKSEQSKEVPNVRRV